MSAIARCSLCPRLCRTACPVATGAAREAAVPAQIASAVLAWTQGRLPREAVKEAVTLCVDCGACRDLCHLHVPLPEALASLRTELGTAPPPPEPRRPEEGAVLLVITPREEALGDRYRQAVEGLVGESVGTWPAPDRLGEGSLEHRDVDRHLDAVRQLAAGRRVITAHRGVEAVLRAADVRVVPLWELAGIDEPHSCGAAGTPIACCGGRRPFADQHPDDARRMAEHWLLREGPTSGLDARCSGHLCAAGAPARSVAELWLEEAT